MSESEINSRIANGVVDVIYQVLAESGARPIEACCIACNWNGGLHLERSAVKKLLDEHALNCPGHPMRALEAANARLRQACDVFEKNSAGAAELFEENRRLRAALERIAGMPLDLPGTMKAVAREALS